MPPSADILSLLWTLPFAALLLAIAVLPLAAPHFWERNRHKALVVAVLALPVLVRLLVADRPSLVHAGLEYASFMTLLGSLFVISSGVLVTGDIPATPGTNAVILTLGALLANVFGTTGASMLLIRPLLRVNRDRQRTTHTVVFFIFLVSNIGGCLTPLGDPPLFLGYLGGVPFTWTFRLWREWAFMLAALLAIYVFLDAREYRRESRVALSKEAAHIRPIRVRGFWNLALLLGVVLAVAFLKAPARELAMIAAALVSLRTTSHHVRQANEFSWGPIVEVAVLFAGIFVTMVPALRFLDAHGAALGLRTPLQFFIATGALSSFLDNAPTYLTFLSVARGLHGAVPGPSLEIEKGLVPESLLAAISLGAVFMGANTYIGNGPNFMVKAIAERANVRMPSFFGYMGWSLAVLTPLFAVLAVLFLT